MGFLIIKMSVRIFRVLRGTGAVRRLTQMVMESQMKKIVAQWIRVPLNLRAAHTDTL